MKLTGVVDEARHLMIVRSAVPRRSSDVQREGTHEEDPPETNSECARFIAVCLALKINGRVVKRWLPGGKHEPFLVAFKLVRSNLTPMIRTEAERLQIAFVEYGYANTVVTVCADMYTIAQVGPKYRPPAMCNFQHTFVLEGKMDHKKVYEVLNDHDVEWHSAPIASTEKPFRASVMVYVNQGAILACTAARLARDLRRQLQMYVDHVEVAGHLVWLIVE